MSEGGRAVPDAASRQEPPIPNAEDPAWLAEVGGGDGQEARRWRRLGIGAVLLVALLAVHLFLSRTRTGPVLYQDGIGYLSNARWIAGDAHVPFLGPMRFYHPGYSVLLVPLFIVFDDPGTIYRGVMVVNAHLATGLAVLLYLLARRVFALGRPAAVLAAAVASLYPSVLVQSGFAWSENLFPLAFTACLLLAHKCVVEPRWWSVAGFAATNVALYATHPRALPALLVAGVFLALLWWGRVLPGRLAVLGLAVMGLATTALQWLNHTLYQAMWDTTIASREGEYLSTLLAPATWPTVALRATGQSWYLLVATLGLVGAGVVAFAGKFFAGKVRCTTAPSQPDARAAVAAYALCAAAGMALAGAVVMVNGTRADHVVYGRYNEGFLPPFLVAGAALVLWRPVRRRLLVVGATLAALAVLLGSASTLNGSERLSGGRNPLNVLGILFWDRTGGGVDIAAVTVPAVAVLIALLVLAQWSPSAALVAVALFFLSSAVHVEGEIRPFATSWAERFGLPEAVSDLGVEGPISYDMASYAQTAANAYQFELLGRRFEWFDSRTGERPRSKLVVAGREWPLANDLGAQMVYAEHSYDQVLWLVTDLAPAATWSRTVP